MIDLYCERVAPGLWGEPANLGSNLAFVAAAWAIWRDRASAPRVGAVLAGLAVAIAAGSATFHATATSWGRWLDEGAIVCFEVVFLWGYARRIVGWPAQLVVVALVTLAGMTALARQQPATLNGSLPYVPLFVVAAALSVYHYRTQPRRRHAVAAGALVFAWGIALRTFDLAVCATMPTGTHFLWHLCAAGALVLFARGLLANLDQTFSLVAPSN